MIDVLHLVRCCGIVSVSSTILKFIPDDFDVDALKHINVPDESAETLLHMRNMLIEAKSVITLVSDIRLPSESRARAARAARG